MKPRLQLHCNNLLSAFSLTQEGESWRRQFYDLKQALDYAAKSVSEETLLVVYNESGRVIIEGFVNPAPHD